LRHSSLPLQGEARSIRRRPPFAYLTKVSCDARRTLIRRFSTLYVGRIDLDRCGPAARPLQLLGYHNLDWLTGYGVASFRYDARHRLISASAGSSSVAYQVNALSQRMQKLPSAGAITVFHHVARVDRSVGLHYCVRT
jgi:hypothetical protein